VSANPTVESLKNAQRVVKLLDEERQYLKDPMLTRAEIAFSLRNGWEMSSKVLTGWEHVGRQVLSIHPSLVDAIRFSGSSKIVPEVFRTLPYMNPMVAFSEPPELFSHTAGETLKLLGFICYGKTAIPERVVNTHDPDAIWMCADLVLEVVTKTGQKNVECDYISFPMHGAPFTLKEAVEGVLSRFSWTHGGQDNTVKHKFMRDAVKITIGSMMYLCSTTLEAEKVPRKTVLKSMNPIPRKPFSFYRVGWEIGAALSRGRVNIEIEDPSEQPKPGYEQDPQHRKAHFKTVWTGPGSMTPKTVFIGPYWTKIERLGVRGVNTVRKVVID